MQIPVISFSLTLIFLFNFYNQDLLFFYQLELLWGKKQRHPSGFFLVLEMWISFQLLTSSLRWLKWGRTEVEAIRVFMTILFVDFFQDRMKCLLCRSRQSSEVNEAFSHYCAVPWGKNTMCLKAEILGCMLYKLWRNWIWKSFCRLKLYLQDMALLKFHLYTCNFLFDVAPITQQISSNLVNFF